MLCNNMKEQQERDGSVKLRVDFLAMTTDMIASHVVNGSNADKTLDLLQGRSKGQGLAEDDCFACFVDGCCGTGSVADRCCAVDLSCSQSGSYRTAKQGKQFPQTSQYIFIEQPNNGF